ncbi:G-protein coupled receptor family C group 6 member A [Astyanax mexicanus]|uniref:G-protein coupled receptor family C group 6 member A n=1 Tax=Astyanax mexicanus TaxID=7994 RepID=A0A8T2M9P8_ASTMX|nr:G-protein coupled receptor family C group 6 member A [Astyanax mexicanus]
MSYRPFLSLLVLLMLLALTEQVSDALQRKTKKSQAVASGNVIIGGLFPIHSSVKKPAVMSQPKEYTCTGFSTTGLVQSLAMIHAIEVVNNSTLLSSLGIRLGYKIHDTCSDVTTALRATEDLMQREMECYSTTNFFNMSDCIQPTTAVIGAYHSETSIAVARDLNLQEIPQISYASSADILSDKSRFPGFFRTVPSDMHQTSAMVKLLKENKWTWVGVITTDGDYGRSALDSFMSQAFLAGICLAFKEVLPDSVSDSPKLQSAVSRTVRTLNFNTKVKVVVSFAKPEHMRLLFQELHSGQSSFPRLWVASDNWSTSEDVIDPGELNQNTRVIGFSFESRDVTPFKEFLKKLEFNSEAQANNSFLKDFYSNNKPQAVEKLINTIDAGKGTIFSIQMAVSAVAQAVAKQCSARDCTVPGSLQPWELLQGMTNSTFKMDGVSYSFDDSGDVDLGYYISLWDTTGQSVTTHNVVSIYNQRNANFSVSNLQLNITSKCSDSCRPGQFKKTDEGQHTCCYSCIDCPENQFSNGTDMDECHRCNAHSEWSDPGSSKCELKTLEYLDWNDVFAVILLTLAAVGIVVVFLVSLLFLSHRDSPVVKAAGGPLCQLILLSLVGSFVSSVFFVGKPTDAQCKVRQVLYGLSFTLCVSCILVKSLKILLAFQVKLELLKSLRRLYKPYLIICFCMLVQGANHTWWLILFSPHKRSIINNSTILEECDEGSYVAFGVVMGFIALLALVCFIFAFKGRKLPQKYNEAKFITFGMLVYLMAWVLFIPVYVTTAGKYLPAVEMAVILISNYSILCCHFFPKCYAILFRSMSNTRDDFMRNVYEYSKKSTRGLGDFSLPDASKSKESPYVISNIPCFFPKRTESEQSLEPTAPPASAWTMPRLTRKRTLSI